MQLTTPMTDALERYMDLSTLELKLTAQNMANVDTPGYRTVGFDFAGEMRRSIEALGRGGGATEAALGEPRLGPVGGLLERPDGNDVSMDREGMKMAEAQLQFRAAEALVKNQFGQVMDAIHEDEK
jgi:flagellar basal-body rod protein FlgB